MAALAYAARQPEMQKFALAWMGKAQDGPQSKRDRAIPVVAAPATMADVPVYATGVGTVRPINAVVIRAQVSGRITEIRFQEGQDIKKGEVIARLDDALYRAQRDQAIAKKAQDDALLENAVLEDARLQRLAGNAVASQQQLDNQHALVAQNKAQVQADQAAIEAAQAQLDYTTIRAPIDGRTGIRNVDVGNIVSSGDTNGIVTLAQIQPITVIFSVPQQELAHVNAANGRGPLAVDVFADDGGRVLASGKLTVIDNQVDAATGTVRLKAEFANEALALWPGAFVNARLLIETMKDVLTVPSAAIQRGPGGTYCYVVRNDKTVTVAPVDVTMQDDRIAVVKTGLTQGDEVVTTGFARLQEGAEVRVATPEEADPAKMAVPLTDEAHGRRRKGGGKSGNHDSASGAASPSDGGPAQGEGSIPGHGKHHAGTPADRTAPAASNAGATPANPEAAPARDSAK